MAAGRHTSTATLLTAMDEFEVLGCINLVTLIYTVACTDFLDLGLALR